MKRLITFLSIIALSFIFIAPTMADSNSEATAGSDSTASTYIGDIGSNNQSGDMKRYFAPAGVMNYP